VGEYHHVVDAGRQQDQQGSGQQGLVGRQRQGQKPDQQRHQHEVGQQQGADEASVGKCLPKLKEWNLQEHGIHQHGNRWRDGHCRQISYAFRGQACDSCDGYGDEIQAYLVMLQPVSRHPQSPMFVVQAFSHLERRYLWAEALFKRQETIQIKLKIGVTGLLIDN